jgi:hypothetical protein
MALPSWTMIGLSGTEVVKELQRKCKNAGLAGRTFKDSAAAGLARKAPSYGVF